MTNLVSIALAPADNSITSFSSFVPGSKAKQSKSKAKQSKAKQKQSKIKAKQANQAKRRFFWRSLEAQTTTTDLGAGWPTRLPKASEAPPDEQMFDCVSRRAAKNVGR